MSEIIYNQYLARFDALRQTRQGRAPVVEGAVEASRSALGRKLTEIAERDAALTSSPKSRLELLLALLEPHPA